MAPKVHMVIGTAVASKETKYPPGSRRSFIFLYLADLADVVFAEAEKFLVENHWQNVECQRVALLDVEKLASHQQAVQDAYMTAARGMPSLIIFEND